jgi:hypothetical protein
MDDFKPEYSFEMIKNGRTYKIYIPQGSPIQELYDLGYSFEAFLDSIISDEHQKALNLDITKRQVNEIKENNKSKRENRKKKGF